MPATPPKKPDRFMLQPYWILLAILTILFVSAVHGFLYVDSGQYFFRLLLGFVYLSLIPRLVWGFQLDKTHFTIFLLFFPVKKIPWSEVAQVMLVQRKLRTRRATIPYEYLCLTLKPAEPLPFFYESELDAHKRRNFFLVWHLCQMKPERIRLRCMQAFAQYWQPVQTRKYDYPEPE
ncbi:MAG: hypothetical protein E7459_00010 [Ruminococcaceae bacterium]|nr:hypothetical protein [Oscillospiraceae bacterium]